MAMIIKRDYYLQQLISSKSNNLIKIVTGIRRSGKSFLLFNLFHNHLIETGVSEDHIIEIALDDRLNKNLRDPDVILQHIHERIVDDKLYYIILDEVPMSDFSVMLRQAYDGTPYDREAKSAEAVNVHIDKLLWNVVMCGTPDALYRVITNYTDGFQSRVAMARTPDNTFSPLSESLFLLTESQQMKIQQVAHLLPLMSGDVDLPKLEKKGRDWLERIRIETLKSYDKTKARQRFRTCPTAMRMMTCLMLCRVAEQMIQNYGEQGAETRLKAEPELWKTMLQRQQTPQMLAAFDVLADYMIDNAMLFFRERIETAFRSGSYVSSGKTRSRKSKNDSIYEELADRFTTEEAYGVSVGIRGGDISNGSVRTMLSRWEQQGMVERIERGVYKKSHYGDV